MTNISLILAICLAVCGYFLIKSRKALKAKSTEKQYSKHLASVAIKELRCVIHGIGWATALSDDLSELKPFIRAADNLGCATFMFSLSSGYYYSFTESEKYLFSRENQDYGNELAELDLGEFNSRRDDLMKNPNLEESIAFIGSLMDHVNEEAERKRHSKNLSAQRATNMVSKA